MEDQLAGFPGNVPLMRRVAPDNLDRVEEKVTQLQKVHWSEWAKGGGAITGAAAAVQAEYREMGARAIDWWNDKLLELRNPDCHIPTEDMLLQWPVPEDHRAAPLTADQRRLLDLMDDPSKPRHGPWGKPTEDLLEGLLACEASGKHKMYQPTNPLHIYEVGDKPQEHLTTMAPGDASANVKAEHLVLIHLEREGSTMSRGWEIAVVTRVYELDSTAVMDIIYVHPQMEAENPTDDTPWPDSWDERQLLKWKVANPNGKGTMFYEARQFPIEDHVVWYSELRKKQRPKSAKLGKLTNQQRSLLQAAIASILSYNAEHGTMSDDDGGDQLRRTFTDDDDSDLEL
jgi:hypothetical protein